MIPHPS
jgi:hypothetical protein